ncbi:MAG: hypothetical protein IKO59_03740 [Bacteroidales bacterium]|nr:hypothetical protein [Bacteroidales bacterium]
MKRIALFAIAVLVMIGCQPQEEVSAQEPQGSVVYMTKDIIDLVFNHTNSNGDDAKPLVDRINRKHGIHTVEHAEKIGLGSRKYTIVSIDK